MKKPRLSYRRQLSRALLALGQLQRNVTELVQSNDTLKHQVTHYCDAFQRAVAANFALAEMLRDQSALSVHGNNVQLPKAVMAWAKKNYANHKTK